MYYFFSFEFSQLSLLSKYFVVFLIILYWLTKFDFEFELTFNEKFIN